MTCNLPLRQTIHPLFETLQVMSETGCHKRNSQINTSYYVLAVVEWCDGGRGGSRLRGLRRGILSGSCRVGRERKLRMIASQLHIKFGDQATLLTSVAARKEEENEQPTKNVKVHWRAEHSNTWMKDRKQLLERTGGALARREASQGESEHGKTSPMLFSRVWIAEIQPPPTTTSRLPRSSSTPKSRIQH